MADMAARRRRAIEPEDRRLMVGEEELDEYLPGVRGGDRCEVAVYLYPFERRGAGGGGDCGTARA